MILQAASKDCSQLAGINSVEERLGPFEEVEAYWMFMQLGNRAMVDG
jgi:hypothetical protein